MDKQNSPTEGINPDADGTAALGVAAAAAAIRSGELQAEAYASALIERARAKYEINAFITIDETAVLEAARRADKLRALGSTAPLLGVPVGVKDSYLTSGLRTTLGVQELRNFIPSEDAEVVRAIKDAGGIVFGKNNLVEMSYGLTGANSAYGQVRNPNGQDHVTGGSSSGSGASVAAGIVPAAFGGDTVGSIRVPASLNGVVGFKPTTGRWPRGGVAPISHLLDTTGVFARSVRDIEVIDQVIAGTQPGPEAVLSLTGVRLALAPRHYLAIVEHDVEAQFNETMRHLRDAGAEIVELDFGEDFSALAERLTWGAFFHDTKQAIDEFLRAHQIPTSFEDIYQGLEGGLRQGWDHFVVPGGPGNISDEAYNAILSIDRPEIQRRFDEAFARSGAEGLIFPTTPTTAPRIDQQSKFLIAGEEVTSLALARNTIPASGAGLPAISIPIGRSRNGLPIGLEIDGRYGRDSRLLALARQVEAVVAPSL